ncbi:MAG: ThuA domain-containing protein, partial [Sedimentisphaerales bacterium]|nr:ThuA domain-containing protein [Sedimentisphaerales bacterium]
MRKAISVFVVILALCVVVGVLAAANGGGKVKVLFLRGGGVHDWNGNTPILTAILEKTGDFDVTYTENLDDLKDRIRQFDIVIQYTTGMSLTPGQEKGYCDFVADGGGYVGIHSATDSFKNA